jgi:predicted GNAT family acetyltransferase
VANEIRAGGDRPFLHAVATNETAIRLYVTLGFTVRRTVPFAGLRAPGGPSGPLSPR